MFESFTAGAERALKRARLGGAAARRGVRRAARPAGRAGARGGEPSGGAAGGVRRDRPTRLQGARGRAGPRGETILGRIRSRRGGAPSRFPRSAALRLVLSEAMNQARGLDRSREVGTEHLLAGLMAASEPVADLLRSAGLELQSLRDRLAKVTRRGLGADPDGRGHPSARSGRGRRRRGPGRGSSTPRPTGPARACASSRITSGSPSTTPG